eukprot:TRINITY_DN29350_c0_g2_i1.p1 TRINITY_DN29350_c0_g2~~TRINITY_DN29350_c0_g2_i1.p1  ORF type:complete len:482 (+),score=53.16 TRINITY_DN29350_c0_g2_i1:181-1626(+)
MEPRPFRRPALSFSTNEHPLSDADEETPLVDGISPERLKDQLKFWRRCKLRKSYPAGEQRVKAKHTTWTIDDDDQESLDDVSIVINLLADLSPAGILPLSFGMVGVGFVPALVLLIVFASAAAYMMYLVGRTIELSGKKSYDRMWADLIGPGSAWLPTFVILSVCFGCCIAYACMFGDLFARCMPALGASFASRTRCLAMVSVFPLLPLCYMKDLSALAPTSVGALIAVVFTVGVMSVRCYDGSYVEGGKYYSVSPPQAGDHMLTVGPKTLLLVNALAVAFLCHYNGCKYYREYVNHRPDRFGGKVVLAFFIVSLMFAGAMLLGYMTFGTLSDGVILNNYAANDMLANVARIAMGFANMFSFPLMFSGLREQSLALLAYSCPRGQALFDAVGFQNLLSTVMLVIIMTIAVLVTDIRLVVGLVGSICGSATIYVLPCVLFDRASSRYLTPGNYNFSERLLVRSIAFVGLCLMLGGAIAAVTI